MMGNSEKRKKPLRVSTRKRRGRRKMKKNLLIQEERGKGRNLIQRNSRQERGW